MKPGNNTALIDVRYPQGYSEFFRADDFARSIFLETKFFGHKFKNSTSHIYGIIRHRSTLSKPPMYAYVEYGKVATSIPHDIYPRDLQTIVIKNPIFQTLLIGPIESIHGDRKERTEFLLPTSYNTNLNEKIELRVTPVYLHPNGTIIQARRFEWELEMHYETCIGQRGLPTGEQLWFASNCRPVISQKTVRIDERLTTYYIHSCNCD